MRKNEITEQQYKKIIYWARKNVIKPNLCERCGLTKPYQLVNKSRTYALDVKDWFYGCRSCAKKHLLTGRFRERDFDGKFINL